LPQNLLDEQKRKQRQDDNYKTTCWLSYEENNLKKTTETKTKDWTDKKQNVKRLTGWPRNLEKKMLTLIVRNTRGGSRWDDGLLCCRTELLNIIINQLCDL
jgi:hypothetical protein